MAEADNEMNSPTVVTFVSEDYIPIGLNWLAAFNALGIAARIRIVALDTATRDAFPSELVLYRPCDPRRRALLWQHRIRVLNEMLAEGLSLIHSDVDAVWLRDPLPALAACRTDMVFSQGTIWPPDVHQRQGIVLCCGFFYLANTAAVRDFFHIVERQVAIDKDDQITINRLLDQAGISWDVDAPYTLSYRNKEIRASRDVIRSREGTIPSVAILPHHLFPRLVEEMHDNVIVCHPLAPKTCQDKIDVLSSLGLWR
ncbi:MAG: hypothetical protein GC184_03370 [Rhizobiales bacterium]|nr:hypothetical protein [Hyphomicrobiales bacterium]